MKKKLTSPRFEVCVEGTHGVIVPDEIAKPFVEAEHKRIEMHAFFEDKHIKFHGALHTHSGNYMISFGKRYQTELGIYKTDYFELQLTEDTSKYGVEMPEELDAVLSSDPEAASIFESFTDGMKRSLIYYISRFKNTQTRIDKALILSENMKMGIRDKKEIIKSHR